MPHVSRRGCTRVVRHSLGRRSSSSSPRAAASPALLVAQRVDRIQLRRFARGVDAEEDADGDAEGEGEHDGVRETMASKPAKTEMSREAPMPRSDADDAAEKLSVMASMRNWSRMSLPCAPTAMRMPISRVRSVTLTSMMFMMPMPPTTSDTLAMEPSMSVMTREMLPTVSAISFWFRIL